MEQLLIAAGTCVLVSDDAGFSYAVRTVRETAFQRGKDICVPSPIARNWVLFSLPCRCSPCACHPNKIHSQNPTYLRIEESMY